MKGKIITKLIDLKRLAKKMETIDEFAFDTETNTKDWCNADNDIFRIVDLQICFGEYDRYCIPMGHIYDPTPQLSVETVVKYLKPIFERIDVTIIGHFLKFDLHVMARLGIITRTPYLFDTAIAGWLIDENQDKGLKPSVLRLFNYKMEEYNDVVAKVPKEIKKKAGLKSNQKATFDMTMIDQSESYATDDAYFAFRLYILYLELLEKAGMEKIFYKIYPRMIRIVFEMEEAGITLDKEACKEMGDEIQADIDELEYQILEKVGVPFSITSSQQLAQLLFGYDQFKTVLPELIDVNYGFPVKSKTAKGVPQTNNATLEQIARTEYKNKHKQEGVEVVKLILQHKELSKLHTFTESFGKLVYPDGKIHCNLNIIGTTSGRFSSSNPNLQQIPNGEEDDKYALRKLFVGDKRPGKPQEHIISCDFSNLEVRVMAHFSLDQGLLDAFAHGVDLHGNTAKLMFRLDCEANEVKKKYPQFRAMGKTIAFLLQYGGSVMALETKLNANDMLTNMLNELKMYQYKKDLPSNLQPFWGCKSTKEMAQKLMDLYFEAFPGITKFMKKQKKFAHKHEKIYTVLGRERRLPFINSSNYSEVGYAERLSINATIQGCQTEDTHILTTKGYKAIKDIDDQNDTLITHTGTTKDYHIYNTGVKEVYKMKTLHSMQKVTMEHRFAVYDKGELIFKRLKDLSIGDLIVYEIPEPSRNIVIDKYFNSHELIGALIGDGNYSSRNAIRLCGGENKLNYLYEAKSYVENILGYNLRIERSSGSRGVCYQFTTENKSFRKSLENLGLTRASKQNKFIPDHYLTDDLQTKCSLLRGLFNTDGGWSGDILTYTSKVQDICYKVYLLLNSIGISCRYKELKDNVYRVFVDSSSYTLFNELIGFKVKFKQDRLEHFLDKNSSSLCPKNLAKDVARIVRREHLQLTQSESSLCCKLNKHGGSLKSCIMFLQRCSSQEAKDLLTLIQNLHFTKITDIEYMEKLPTMDIEIFTEDHSYIANGLLNHNSGADIMLFAMLNISKSEKLKELGCKLLLQIHDELLFSCPEENCEEAIAITRECMVYPFGREKLLNLPLEIGAGHGHSYATGH